MRSVVSKPVVIRVTWKAFKKKYWFGGSIPPPNAESWKRKWQPIPVILLGKSHGQRSLVGYSPWGRNKQLSMDTHFSLCICFSLMWPRTCCQLWGFCLQICKVGMITTESALTTNSMGLKRDSNYGGGGRTSETYKNAKHVRELLASSVCFSQCDLGSGFG